MTRHLLLVAAALSWVGCQCGPNLCSSTKCGLGMACDPADGMCRLTPSDAGATDGGTSGCVPACSTQAPVCDPADNTCKACTATAGCEGAKPLCNLEASSGLGECVTCTENQGCPVSAPYCDLSVSGGQCWQCRTQTDCAVSDTVCEPLTHTCQASDGGTGGGDGGGGSGVVVFDDAGMTAHCLTPSGTAPASCVNECQNGFVCIGGQCYLRGSTGPVQVTLRFAQSEDLDLHVLEPLPDAGTCEIWWNNTNYPVPPGPLPIPPGRFECGATGWLDLDTNAACALDNVNIENVIFPPSTPAPRGTYTVRVDYFENCSASQPVPYEVEVRANNETRYYCGSFQPNQYDHGNDGSGVTVTQFTVQ